MMHFETYRWEDHVPRKGSWKFNLLAGTVAVGLIATALPGPRDDQVAPFSTSQQADPDLALSSFHLPRRDVPVVLEINGRRTYCPATQADS